jgi:hypothetical protein
MQPSWAQALQKLGIQGQTFQGVIIGNHRNDNASRAHHLTGLRPLLCPQRHQGLCPLPAAIVHPQVVPGLQKPSGHGLSHIAQANKAYLFFHTFILPVTNRLLWT